MSEELNKSVDAMIHLPDGDYPVKARLFRNNAAGGGNKIMCQIILSDPIPDGDSEKHWIGDRALAFDATTIDAGLEAMKRHVLGMRTQTGWLPGGHSRLTHYIETRRADIDDRREDLQRQLERIEREAEQLRGICPHRYEDKRSAFPARVFRSISPLARQAEIKAYPLCCELCGMIAVDQGDSGIVEA